MWCVARVVGTCGLWRGRTNGYTREGNQAEGTTEGTTRGGDGGRQDFLLIAVDCNDILERCAANRVAALSCVCYQQEEAGRASRDSERFGRIDADDTPRLVVSASIAVPVPYGQQIT